MCVTNFTCIPLENQVHAAVCGSGLPNVSAEVTFMQAIFAMFLVVL